MRVDIVIACVPPLTTSRSSIPHTSPSRSTLDRLRANIDHAHKGAEPFHFAAKVVRGAYLTSERKRAAENQLLDPIHDEIKHTHRAYDTAVTLLLERAATAEARSSASPLGVSLCVATHNKDSVVHACVEMSRHGIAPADGVVQFGQLLGMHDHISYTLARHNYPVAKYVPYGAVGDVIPYLLRRAQENRSIFKVSDSLALDDQTLIKREILRRVRNAFSLRATSL